VAVAIRRLDKDGDDRAMLSGDSVLRLASGENPIAGFIAGAIFPLASRDCPKPRRAKASDSRQTIQNNLI